MTTSQVFADILRYIVDKYPAFDSLLLVNDFQIALVITFNEAAIVVKKATPQERGLALFHQILPQKSKERITESFRILRQHWQSEVEFLEEQEDKLGISSPMVSVPTVSGSSSIAGNTPTVSEKQDEEQQERKRSKPMLPAELLKWNDFKVGDLIQFSLPERPLIYHEWAVYVGDGKIAHFAKRTKIVDSLWRNLAPWPFVDNTQRRIYIEPLIAYYEAYGNGVLVGVNNWADGSYCLKTSVLSEPKDIQTRAFSGKTIVERAEKFARDQDKNNSAIYNVLGNNSEHFATLCRYGMAISGQSMKFGENWGNWWH